MPAPRTPSARVLTLLAFLALPAFAGAADWPGFRGPRGDGVSQEKGLLTTWPADGPKVVWQRPLGGGFSGIAIVGGRLYTVFSTLGEEFLTAIDAETGDNLWRVALDVERRDDYGDGPRATPRVDEGRVFALSALGKLHAVRAADGEVLWKLDLRQVLRARLPNWGLSGSPVVEGKRLFLMTGAQGSSIIALDKTNGEFLWRLGSDHAGYSTPLVATVRGKPTVFFFTGQRIAAVAPDDGRIHWQQPWKTAYNINAAMPVWIAPDRLFVSSGQDVGAALFRIAVRDGTWQVEELWRNPEMRNFYSTSVHVGGHLYGFDEKALKCLKVENGEMLWRKSGFGHGSLLYADGHLIVLGERGQLALVEADPEGYREVAHGRIKGGRHWTVPTLCGGRLYVRNERDLVSLQVGPPVIKR